MKIAPPLVCLLLLAAVACDKPDAPADKPAASATAPVSAPTPTPEPTPSAPPQPTASASAAPASTAPTKEAVVSVFDPVKEPARTAKVLAGGSVALYVPEWAGTSWKVTQPDAALGKPKEETIPGFAGPGTPAHAFTWQIKDGLKGQSHKLVLTNTAAKGAPAKAPAVFTLGIDVS